MSSHADLLVSTAVDDGRLDPETCNRVANAFAEASAAAPADAAFSLYVLASSRPRILALPPTVAIEVQLQLLAGLGPVADVSLWQPMLPGLPEVVASVGPSARTRGFRALAAATVAGKPPAGSRSRIQAVPVERFGTPVAALVARPLPDDRERATSFLLECAATLAPLLEREALLARSAQRDQELHAAGERRLRRLGFDLHDGPLQDLAALSADLHLARRQVGGVLDAPLRTIVLGRFDDLAARLGEIDEALREISHSLESSSVVDRSLPEILGREVTAFDRRMGIETRFTVNGLFDDLTASQRIALFRIAQEALTNVRDHTDATEVTVRLERLVDGTRLVVADNGGGFDVAQTVVVAARRGRLGLVGMNERVRLLGGTFTLDSRPSAGTELTVVLPHWQPATAATGLD